MNPATPTISFDMNTFDQRARAVQEFRQMSETLAKEIVAEIAKEIASVQPMPVIPGLFNRTGPSESELEAAGFKPVSRLRLMWIKK